MDGLEAEWDDQVEVIRLNVLARETRPFLDEYSARYTPTFILLNGDGEEVWRQIGNLNVAELQEQVALLNR